MDDDVVVVGDHPTESWLDHKHVHPDGHKLNIPRNVTEKRIDFLACFDIRLVACWGRIQIYKQPLQKGGQGKKKKQYYAKELLRKKKPSDNHKTNQSNCG